MRLNPSSHWHTRRYSRQQRRTPAWTDGQTSESALDEHCARERHASGCKWAEATQQQEERAVQLDRG
eukprot:CAMPEP_0206166928 /NCGR_PEP_ID=MMETSP1474-20131121/26021_1 /ASSEMBLY_ACC=CAM_ASM_001110 /TAXON_ID=97495 /ORGANISM="Imantonia sp., Strain RCC918" /LENGTH=66 /DNA_ID=CAMNT_0053571253 /DNA_START=212 /DNA_END=409 /DNA_ORIENTATION=-